MKRVAVLGAGPAGLTVAALLSEKCRVVVYEKDDRPGGMSACFDFEGESLERYYHMVLGADKNLFKLIETLGMGNTIHWVPTKMGMLRKNITGIDELQEWGNPAALFRFRGLSLILRLRYALHIFYCKYVKYLMSLDDISAKNWICRWIGKAGYDAFWDFLFKKKFFQFSDPLSAAWIASRIQKIATSRESLMREKRAYIEGGSQTLLDALTRKIKQSENEIRLSEPVVKVVPDNTGKYHVISSKNKEHYDFVVSTIPLPYISDIIDDLPKQYKIIRDKVKNIGCACVIFKLKKSLSDYFWINVDIPECDVLACVEYSNLRPMQDKYIYVPFYMPHNHPNWAAADEVLIDKARSCMRLINADAADSEQAVQIFRYEYAQPICPPGFRHILPPYETDLSNLLIADTSHSFPADRSIDESIRIANELFEIVLAKLFTD